MRRSAVSSKALTKKREDMNEPLVSIITPTYNHEAFIAECIQSVLDQSYAQWEMIVVDDGSIDRTGEIVRAFSDRDSRIRYLSACWPGVRPVSSIAIDPKFSASCLKKRRRRKNTMPISRLEAFSTFCCMSTAFRP